MKYRNIYPSTPKELIEMLPDVSDELDNIFLTLLQTAVANQPRCVVDITPDPRTGYTESQMAIPLDNSILLVSQVTNVNNTHSAYTLQLGRPLAATMSAESILYGTGDTEPLRTFGLGKFAVDGVIKNQLCIKTPALYKAEDDGTPHFYYLSNYDVKRALPVTEYSTPTIHPEALPAGGQRIFDEYGPFGVVKYEIEQDVTLLRNAAERYS